MMSAQPAASSPTAAGENRRAERHDLTGAQMKLLVEGINYTVHLKDLSATGLCGLTDAPLAPGQIVCLLIEKSDPVAAEIKWIRKALIGAAFTQPLPDALVSRLKRNHSSKRR